jgi:hypothetical protein
MAAPINIQFSMLMRILTFDRNLKTRVGAEITIGIIYNKKFKKSINIKNEIMNMVNDESYIIKKIEDIPIHYIEVDISNNNNLESIILQNNIDVIYMTPMGNLQIEPIINISRSKQIATLTGVPDYVESGLAVGVGAEGGRPSIIINLPAAKAEGMDFEAQLLKLTRVIK